MLRRSIIINKGNIWLGFHIGITRIIMVCNKGFCFHKSAFIMLRLTCFCLVYIGWTVNDRISTFRVSTGERKAGSPGQSVFQEHEFRTGMFSSHSLYLRLKAREKRVKILMLTLDETTYFLPSCGIQMIRDIYPFVKIHWVFHEINNINSFKNLTVIHIYKELGMLPKNMCTHESSHVLKVISIKIHYWGKKKKKDSMSILKYS